MLMLYYYKLNEIKFIGFLLVVMVYMVVWNDGVLFMLLIFIVNDLLIVDVLLLIEVVIR